MKLQRLIIVLQQVFNNFHIKNPTHNNNNKPSIHRQANMFCTKDKQYRNNKNTSKSTSVLKCYNCGKTGHILKECRSPQNRANSAQETKTDKKVSQKIDDQKEKAKTAQIEEITTWDDYAGMAKEYKEEPHA